jgi:PAS domain S-box-containing protein
MASNEDRGNTAGTVDVAPWETSGVLRAVLGWLPEPALLVDSDAIVFANTAAAQLLATSEDELLQRSAADFLPLQDVEAPALPGAGVTDPRMSERTVLRADGVLRRVEIASTAWCASDRRRCRLLLLHDVTHRRQAQDTLQRTQARLRRLAARRDTAQHADRQRFARFLHDNLQQSLAAILYELEAVSEQLTAVSPASRAPLARVNGLALAALESTAQVIEDLQPLIVQDLGIVDAAQALAHRFQQRTGIRCRIRAHGLSGDPAATSEHDVLMYGVLQEALDNVARHALASSVSIVLVRNAAGALRLRIRDDGIGLKRATQDSWALGLQGLLERVRAAGGLFSARNGHVAGTIVDLHLPPRGHALPPPLADATQPSEHSYDKLLGFLYQVPVGLVDLWPDGRISMINPMAVQILMPLTSGGALMNLYDALRGELPRLASWVSRAPAATTSVCEAVALSVPAGEGKPPRRFELGLHRLADGHLMAVIAPVGSAPSHPQPSDELHAP